MEPLTGWNIVRAADTEWAPWGGQGNARAKVLGTADGYFVALVEADTGYRGDPHDHTNAEFFYLLEGTIRNQGQVISAGDGYAAAAGSTHTDFVVESAARYLIIFRL
jgi:mannose-6-phosphate isomerase-like protein (cupin superfamily)